MRHRRFLLAVLVALCSEKVLACGIGPLSYLTYGGRDALAMPNTIFDIECQSILGASDPAELVRDVRNSRVELFALTCDTDLREFAEAVRDDPKAREMIDDYETVRSALCKLVFRWLHSLQPYYYSFERETAPEPFDLAPYEERLASVPEEFKRYLRGAAAYFNQDWDAAAAHFASVLELPVEQRAHRSTWAAFMLGKTWLRKDPARAIPFFEKTRALAAEGFADTLGLAEASVGWQAQAEMKSGVYVDAIHRYAGIGTGAALSLRVVCSRALDEKPVDPALVQDELSRRIVTAWLVAHTREKDKARKWLDALQSTTWDGVVPGADRMAWFAYQNGDMACAEKWLAHCEPKTPFARWVDAKLLLRKGRIDEGTALLQELADTFPRGDAWKVRAPLLDDGSLSWVEARGVVREELGYALFKQADYHEALLEFLRVDGDRGNWHDALFLAERVMTPEELQEFVETEAGNPKLTEDDPDPYDHCPPDCSIAALRHTLARRWARMGMWDKALPYYPDQNARRFWQQSSESIPEVAARARARADGANDSTLPPRERAGHLFELGRLIREYGPDLFCPELIPDATARDRFSPPDFPADLPRRLEESLEPYPRMNHFVWVAADMMRQAAELLPDNDVLTAHALYLGGVYLKNVDPKAADQFYKALVRRNPNLLIARQADELRWFPRKFTDVVLYQPRPEQHWYDRKRNVTLAVLVPLGAVGLTLAAACRLRRRFPPRHGR